MSDGIHKEGESDYDALVRLSALCERYRKALEEIVEGRGAHDRDPFEHAKNCIQNMRDIARRALAAEAEEKR